MYLDTQESEDVALVFSALAFDAVTGVLWVFADDEGSAYWPVDRTNPTDWSLGNIAFLDVDVFGADFDSAGQLFATIYQSEAVQALATIDLATGLANTVNGFNAARILPGRRAGHHRVGQEGPPGDRSGRDPADRARNRAAAPRGRRVRRNQPHPAPDRSRIQGMNMHARRTLRDRRVAAIALAPLLVASPAAAGRPCLDGQKLTTVVQFTEDTDVTQMFNTSPVDAASTAIGAARRAVHRAGHRRQRRRSRICSADQPGRHDQLPYLWVADANTGVFSNPVLIDPTTNITITSCEGIDLQPNGEILIACFNHQNTDFSAEQLHRCGHPGGRAAPFLTNGVNAAPLAEWDALA